MDKRIQKILERWFLVDPAFFQVLCMHSIVPNKEMECPFRTGGKRVEYNPEKVEALSSSALEEYLKAEAIRILLKHPYSRRPDGCDASADTLGSNLVLGDNYAFDTIRMETPEEMDLPKGECYEWYALKMMEYNATSAPGSQGGEASNGPSVEGQGEERGKAGDGKGDGGDAQNAERQALADAPALWQEDALAECEINRLIESCEQWGSMPGKMVERIKASSRAKIDWRNVLAGFRSSILSSRPKLTRMRPNRRTGFQNMGSIRQFDTRLLVAVDVSGSVSCEDISRFYGVINSAFRYGFVSIDTVQFDDGLAAVRPLSKAVKEIEIKGRGGTSFQEPVEYAHRNGYDGLVILTDGFAPSPVIPDHMRCKILWACQDRKCYERHRVWMEKTGRCCAIP